MYDLIRTRSNHVNQNRYRIFYIAAKAVAVMAEAVFNFRTDLFNFTVNFAVKTGKSRGGEALDFFLFRIKNIIHIIVL